MLEKNKLDRLNELARSKKIRALTEQETAEHQALREEYLNNFRTHFTGILDNIQIKNPDGSVTQLKKKQ